MPCSNKIFCHNSNSSLDNITWNTKLALVKVKHLLPTLKFKSKVNHKQQINKNQENSEKNQSKSKKIQDDQDSKKEKNSKKKKTHQWRLVTEESKR